MRKHWKVFCEETEFPGLWPRWFRNQCVAVGWSPHSGWTMKGKSRKQDWTLARKHLANIQSGDMLLVQLKHNRVGRIGEVVRKEIEDAQWNPTVARTKEYPWGRLGRRILVRWDLTGSPPDPDTVVLLPKSSRLPTYLALGTIRELDNKTFFRIKKAMEDDSNWVGLQGRFDYERSLSDFVATYPHRLEDDLLPFPDVKVRENVFPDGTRSDVLLTDTTGNMVVVECKQGAPTLENIKQLRGYMRRAQKYNEGKKVRGILVHGGASSLRDEVAREIRHDRSLKVIRYSLLVDFVPYL